MQLFRVVYACTMLYSLNGAISAAVHVWEGETGLGGEDGWAGHQTGILGDMMELFKVKLERLEKSEKQLRQSIGTLISTNVHIRIDTEKATHKFATLEAELRQQIKGLQSTVKQLVESNRDTEGRLAVLTELKKVSAERQDEDAEAKQSYIQDVCQSQAEYVAQPTCQCNTMSGNGDRQNSPVAAFTAYRDGAASEAVTSQDAPIYNRVLLNVGGAYNTDTGIFTTPVSGIYLFSWAWKGGQGSGEGRWHGLVVNGQQQVGLETGNNVDNESDQGSSSAVLRLAEGDRVWTILPGNLLGADKDRTSTGNDKTSANNDRSSTDKDMTSADNDRTSAEKDKASADNVKTSGDKDRTSTEKDKTIADKDAKTRVMGAERSASFTGVLLNRELDTSGP